jgi:hypothetical protein
MLKLYEIEFLTSVVVKIQVFLDVILCLGYIVSDVSKDCFASSSGSVGARRVVVKILRIFCSYKEANNGSAHVSPQQQLNNLRWHFVT